MSAFKGTPGPWVAALDHNSRPIVWGPGTQQITDCWHTPDGNGWGNARLIAAAPELLEALLKLVDSCDDSDGAQYGTLSTSFVRSIATAAIAKATGGAA